MRLLSIIAGGLHAHPSLQLHFLYVLGSRQFAEHFCDAFSDLLDYTLHDVRDFSILSVTLPMIPRIKSNR